MGFFLKNRVTGDASFTKETIANAAKKTEVLAMICNKNERFQT